MVLESHKFVYASCIVHPQLHKNYVNIVHKLRKKCINCVIHNRKNKIKKWTSKKNNLRKDPLVKPLNGRLPTSTDDERKKYLR